MIEEDKLMISILDTTQKKPTLILKQFLHNKFLKTLNPQDNS